jgi:hypothetical protein
MGNKYIVNGTRCYKIVLNIYIYIYIYIINTLYRIVPSNYHSYDQPGFDAIPSHLVLRPKLDVHRMCVQIKISHIQPEL